MDATGVRRWLGDVAVAVAAVAASWWVLVSSSEVGTREPDVVGLGLLLAAGTTLLARRRWPVVVLLAVVALTTAVLTLNFAGGSELPLVLVALYTVMAEGRRWAGLGVLGLLVASGAGYRLVVEREEPLLVVVTVSLLALVTALGDGAHTRRELRGQVRERVRMLEVEKDLETRARLTAERLRIARELHDVLAHTITAISVQAGAAADGLDANGDAHRALRSMRTTAQDAMHQLRATITVLRSDRDDRSLLAAPDLSTLDTLVQGVEGSGVEVELTVDGQVRRLPAAVELTAYRIVQEALTNVIRHADAAHARVTLTYGPDLLTVSVVDDGHPAPHAVTEGTGFGLTGMRERAHALGGGLQAGPDAGGGFRVHAELPVDRSTHDE